MVAALLNHGTQVKYASDRHVSPIEPRASVVNSMMDSFLICALQLAPITAPW